MAGAIGFENLTSGFGGVAVVAYFSALCDLRYTAAQFALLTAAGSIVGRILTGATAGALIETHRLREFLRSNDRRRIAGYRALLVHDARRFGRSACRPRDWCPVTRRTVIADCSASCTR